MYLILGYRGLKPSEQSDSMIGFKLVDCRIYDCQNEETAHSDYGLYCMMNVVSVCNRKTGYLITGYFGVGSRKSL